jgi:hypothetical protein
MMRDEIEEDLGVRGGQGRTAGEIHESSLAWAAMIVLAAVAMLFLMGCATTFRPTARNDGEPADKPNWEELRQQIGGL